MKALYKRWLIMGLTLSIFGLARLRRALESQLAAEVKSSLDDPASLPAKETREVKSAPVVPMPVSATTVTFSGTVIRNGTRFALRETGGVLYTLDSTGRAWPFEGEDVRVTGKLDPSTRLLHVDDIEDVAS
jgi:hypothetical protein